MSESVPENTKTNKYPDPRLWLTKGVQDEIFRPESTIRLNTLGGHDLRDRLGAMQKSRIFEAGKNGEIILNFPDGIGANQKQSYTQNLITEYFGQVFRTGISHLRIGGKYIISGKGEQDITVLAQLPIFDTSGDVTQSTESFYNLMRSDQLLIPPKERERILDYLFFLSEVIMLSSSTIGTHIQSDKIKSISLHPSGLLSLNFIDGTVQTYNLLDIYTIAQSPSSEEQKTKLRAAQMDRERLRESLDTESLFDGKILITYAPEIAIAYRSGVEVRDAVTRKYGDSSISSSQRQLQGKRTIEKILIQTNDGTRVVTNIDMNGTKSYIRENILSHLRKRGFEFDIKTGKFVQPELQALRRVLVKPIEEVRTILGNKTLSQKEYDSMKKTLQSIEQEAIRTNTPVHKILTRLMNNIDKALLPLFFYEFSKQQNSLAFIDGFSDWAAFHYGSKLGVYFGSRVPILSPLTKIAGKTVGGMIFGVGGIILKHKGVDIISEGRRSFWRYAYQKEDGVYTSGRSTAAHNAVNLKLPELMDISNNLMGSDTDVGIKARPELNSWIPEVTMFQRKVNMGTAPWQWLEQSKGRTIDDWNTGVDFMKTRMSERIGDILRIYTAKEGVFQDKGFIKALLGIDNPIDRAGSRSRLFSMVLKEVLVADGISGYFGDQVNAISNMVERELTKNPTHPSKENILLIISNHLNMMKIDTENLSLQETVLEGNKNELNKIISQLKPHLSDEKYTYVSTLSQRMMGDQDLVAPGVMREETILGTKSKKWYPSRENFLFQELLDDKTKLSYDSRGILVRYIGGSDGVSIELGAYFATMLDFMLNIKREQDFLDQLKKGNRMGIDWSSVSKDTQDLKRALKPNDITRMP